MWGYHSRKATFSLGCRALRLLPPRRAMALALPILRGSRPGEIYQALTSVPGRGVPLDLCVSVLWCEFILYVDKGNPGSHPSQRDAARVRFPCLCFFRQTSSWGWREGTISFLYRFSSPVGSAFNHYMIRGRKQQPRGTPGPALHPAHQGLDAERRQGPEEANSPNHFRSWIIFIASCW